MKMDNYELNLDYEGMKACAHRALNDVEMEIAKLTSLKKTWENVIKWNEEKIIEKDKFLKEMTNETCIY
jgi:hypothetical protein